MGGNIVQSQKFCFLECTKWKASPWDPILSLVRARQKVLKASRQVIWPINHNSGGRVGDMPQAGKHTCTMHPQFPIFGGRGEIRIFLLKSKNENKWDAVALFESHD